MNLRIKTKNIWTTIYHLDKNIYHRYINFFATNLNHANLIILYCVSIVSTSSSSSPLPTILILSKKLHKILRKKCFILQSTKNVF